MIRFLSPVHTIRISFILTILVTISGATTAQKTYRGLVADSATVESLPGVHVKIKNSSLGVITNQTGIFEITAQKTDTLILTLVGYKPFELPLFFEDDVVMVRMAENIQFLKEVTITGMRLNPQPIIREPRKKPTPFSEDAAFSSPFDYFSRWQREKRKLLKYIEESEKTITYLQVVSDEVVREVIMEENEITVDQYYDLLAVFNEENNKTKNLIYSTNPDEIIKALKKFVVESLQKE